MVIKPGLGSPGQEAGSGLHELTWIVSSQPEKIKKIFGILIFYMKKLRSNTCEYRLYILWVNNEV